MNSPAAWPQALDGSEYRFASMHQSFVMISPLPPATVVDRLARYGKEWRESKIPPGLRSSGIYGCQVTVRSETFKLRLEPQGRGPQLVWTGQVTPEAAGSRLNIRSEQTVGSRASVLAVLLFMAVLWWPTIQAGEWGFVIVGMLFMGGFVAVTTAWRSNSQRAECEAVLGHVTHAKAAVPVPAV